MTEQMNVEQTTQYGVATEWPDGRESFSVTGPGLGAAKKYADKIMARTGTARPVAAEVVQRQKIIIHGPWQDLDE